MRAKPNPRARDPLFYISDYAELNAEYEKVGALSPHRRQWYFGMNLGRLSWIGHVSLRPRYRSWLPSFGFWRQRPGWDAQVLWPLADLEVHWG